ncbi:MAG: peptide-methionine (R)-S-oxide reductase MsrB [Chitinophagaceae bacterium]|nr:MAG: peptide-methionine (R)-S-oxide reductase MsrB [Chitinophagaceae bacterium]
MMFFKYLLIISMSFLLWQCSSKPAQNPKSIYTTMNPTKNKYYSRNNDRKLSVSDSEWKSVLTDEQYYIARKKGTERPWTSKYENFDEIGTYYCAACGNPLFKSDTKFESGCGWPSFYDPIDKTSIIYTEDKSHGMIRTEVQCGKCEAHLGHVFEDGPPPTGLRYCINGVILDFEKAAAAQKNFDKKDE